MNLSAPNPGAGSPQPAADPQPAAGAQPVPAGAQNQHTLRSAHARHLRPSDDADALVTAMQWFWAIVLGLGLAIAVWWPLVQGGGLVGGDVYPYFLPQKVILAEAFQRGEIPLWHNRTSLGYPLLAESQVGVFYPAHQVLYRLLDVNSAYNVNVLLHYWLAFVFAWRFAISQQVRHTSALLVAVVFVYGWFPARISWEWSILGGVFFPLSLWLCDRLLKQPTRQRFAALALCLAVQLLAGHFTLAFITQLTIVAYSILMLRGRGTSTPAGRTSTPSRRGPLLVVGSIAVAALLAAVQLLPTYELKRLSQRAEAGAVQGQTTAFNPAFGHLPPLYITQVIASWWYWHTPEIVASGGITQTPLAVNADTNVVEAHLYWGLLPLLLMLLLVRPWIWSRVHTVCCQTWLLLLVLSLIYATGWLIPITRHLPGFGYFNGPGRYTLISALAGAVLAGQVLDALLLRARGRRRLLITLCACAVTLPDLLWSSRYVADAQAVAVAPLERQSESWLKHTLTAAGPMQTRLLAAGPNVANLFGISSVPEYLGLGPDEYFDESLWPPERPETPDAEYPNAAQLDQITHLGITHVLTTEAVSHPAPALQLIAAQPDALLNSIWGRGGQLCWLYEIMPRPQRIVSHPVSALVAVEVQQQTANSVTLKVQLQDAAIVELKDLMYPGWVVQVDGRFVPPADGSMFRQVAVAEGQHTLVWTFRPFSVVAGGVISVVVLAVLMLTCWRRPRTSVGS